MLFTFLWEKLFEKNFSHWKTANRCCKRCCKLQAPLKEVNFGTKLTHFNVFWLDISFFWYVKKKRSIVCDSYWRYHFLHMWKPLFTHLIGWNSFVYENVWHSFLVSISQYVDNKYMLFTGWEVRIGRNFARGLERAVLRPSAQFLPIQTDLGRWITFLFFSYWDLKVSGKFYFSLQPMCVEEGHVRVDVMHTIDCKPKQNITTWFLTCNLYYHN